jgi:hypothetical protein
LEVYEVLRGAGANPRAKNRLGETPSEIAPRFEMEYALSRRPGVADMGRPTPKSHHRRYERHRRN